jgi:hypothetical protein
MFTRDKYGLHNGLPKLHERLENGLWAFRVKERVFKNWWTFRHTSWVQDLPVRSTKKCPNFAKSILFSIGAVFEEFFIKITHAFRGEFIPG